MRGKMVKSVFKKEMMDILRDKKTLFMTVILPILLYPTLIILMSYVMSSSTTSLAQKTLNIAFSEAPNMEVMTKIEALTEENGKFNIIEVEDYEAALLRGEIAAYVMVENKENTTEYKIYINSSEEDGGQASSRLQKIFQSYKEELISKRINAAGLDEEIILQPITYGVQDTAKSEQVAGYLLGIILPFILVLGILTGAIYPAIDIMAGEKERGTLETLLTLPISNLELVMGKYLAVSLSALVSAIMSLLSISISIVFLILNASELVDVSVMNIDLSRLILPLIITFICICVFTLVISAISMCVCSLAQSFKEAQNAVTPLMIGAMVLSYASMVPNLELNTVTASLPVVNVVLLIKSVLTFKYDLSLLMIVLISNIGFVIISVWLLSKLFKSEEVLFGGGKGFTFLERRSDIKKGTMPSISDGIVLYALTLLLLIYVASYLQMKFKAGGIVITQLLLFSLPILLSIYIKTDFKKVYSLNRIKISGILGSMTLWSGVLIFSLLSTNILLAIFPQDTAYLEALQEQILSSDHVLFNLLIVAVLPAICEETFFRGFILSSLSGDKQYRRGILLSGLLFGMMHMDLIRLLPTTCLGIAIAYAVYKTGSIWAGVLMHFLNNAFSVIVSSPSLKGVTHLVKQVENRLSPLSIGNIASYYIVAFVLIGLGYYLLNYRNKYKKLKINEAK